MPVCPVPMSTVFPRKGYETVQNVNALRLPTQDGKFRKIDCANTEILLRIIQSVPSPNAEPYKLWLAQVGSDRIDEAGDPEAAYVDGASARSSRTSLTAMPKTGPGRANRDRTKAWERCQSLYRSHTDWQVQASTNSHGPASSPASRRTRPSSASFSRWASSDFAAQACMLASVSA